MRKRLVALGILLTITFFSCQDIVECVINTHPELPRKGFSSGRLGQFYSDFIRAEINNSPHDNGYYYDFSFHGELPDGLELYIEHRNVIIEGEPLQKGRFHFRINLYVEKDYDYFNGCENELNNCDGLCTDTTSQDYVIEIF